MTYRHFRDTVANGGHKTDTSPGDITPPRPPITIVLPEAICPAEAGTTPGVESQILSEDAGE